MRCNARWEPQTDVEDRLALMLRLIVAVTMLAATLSAALAQSAYPARPVRLVVPTAPGGPPDFVARLIAQELSKRWNRQVVVDTRPGAGTIIGTEIVAKAPADGYTLLLSPGTLATNPASYKKLPYDVLRDFAPITQTHFVPNLFVIHPSVPVKSVKEFIALAKARPGELAYASAGHGTNPHLAIELFSSMAQVRLTHVPYKGGLPGVTDLMAGRVVMMVTSAMGVVVPHVRTGRLRALAVTSSAPVKALPGIPTLAESVPGYEAVQWGAVLAPAGTPADIIERLNREIIAILFTPEIRERMGAESAEPVGGTPEELAAYIKSETVKWAKVAKLAGIEPE